MQGHVAYLASLLCFRCVYFRLGGHLLILDGSHLSLEMVPILVVLAWVIPLELLFYFFFFLTALFFYFILYTPANPQRILYETGVTVTLIVLNSLIEKSITPKFSLL